jgi:hypothetical protein
VAAMREAGVCSDDGHGHRQKHQNSLWLITH